MAVGIDTVNFGAFPGSLHTTEVVTGQTNIAADSIIEVFIDTKDSVDHSADEHRLEPLKCGYSTIVPGTGFTVEVTYDGEHPQYDAPGFRNPKDPNRESPRAYGVFNIAWAGNWT